VEWPKDNRERIELPVTTKMMECQPSDRKPPTLASRPIQNNGSLAELREDILSM
jgi:hypothetical protein